MGAKPLDMQDEAALTRYEGARWAYEQALKPIDGARGTWSWMLEEGNHGYGLVPMIVDMEWWDQATHTWLVSKDEPYIYPAFITWEATTCFDYDHCEEEIPMLSVTSGSWLGSDADYHCMAIHTFLLDEECFFNSAGEITPFYVPVWAVTPIDENEWIRWANQFSTMHSRVDGWLIDSFLSEDSGWHGEYINPVTGSQDECQGILVETINTDDCPCGLSKAQEQLVNDIYSGALWPTDLDNEFKDVWRWTVSRWLNGWNNINMLRKDPNCPYSLAWSRSPYSRMLDSEDLAHENERLCSIPLMSSVLSQESSTEHSQQSTLFDM
jgi:hypothetical protein